MPSFVPNQPAFNPGVPLPPRPQQPYPQMQGQWDAWGNWHPIVERTATWKIPRNNTEGLIKFDGALSDYKNWKNRIRDHSSEGWTPWREILDMAATARKEHRMEELESCTWHGVPAHHLSADLWSFLLKWIGPTLYARRIKMELNIEGNGVELWRKLFL